MPSETLTIAGRKKQLEEKLASLDCEVAQTHHIPTWMQENRKAILEELEAIETRRKIASGELLSVNGKLYPGGGNTPIVSEETVQMNDFLQDVYQECHRATQLHGGFNSAHEAYGVILEELDEFWDEVKKKRNLRNTDNMRKELVQVAAMCLKAVIALKL